MEKFLKKIGCEFMNAFVVAVIIMIVLTTVAYLLFKLSNLVGNGLPVTIPMVCFLVWAFKHWRDE